MVKTHYKVIRGDHRESGQTDNNYNTQTLCGLGDVLVTSVKKDVTCFWCNKKLNK